MEAFHFVNHQGRTFDAQDSGHDRVVGDLELPAGHFVVWAKADLALTSPESLALPPFWPTSGQFSLTFGGAGDAITLTLMTAKDAQHDNNNVLAVKQASLMLTASTDRTRHARAYFHRTLHLPYGPTLTVSNIRIAALRVEDLHAFEQGTHAQSLPVEVEPRGKETIKDTPLKRPE